MKQSDLLEYLRKEIEDCKEDIKYFQSTIMEIEEFDHTRQLLGKIFAYQQIIKVIRGLSERDYQLELKKGTL